MGVQLRTLSGKVDYEVEQQLRDLVFAANRQEAETIVINEELRPQITQIAQTVGSLGDLARSSKVQGDQITNITNIVGAGTLQQAYDNATAVPQITVLNGSPLTIDLAAGVGAIFQVRDASDVLQFAVRDDFVHGSDLVSGELTLRGTTNANLGLIRCQSPITFDDVTAANALQAYSLADTSTQSFSAVFIGGGYNFSPIVDFSFATFIWEGGRISPVIESLVAPGFAAFTLLQALPVLTGATVTFNPLSALTLNVGVVIQNAGVVVTLTTASNFGMNFAAQTRVTGAFSVMNVTNQGAILCAPKFSTIATTTANLGTIRGMHCQNPGVALFQPATGVETMVAYIGLDMDAMPFGGNVLKVALRSALLDASFTRFIQNIGTAQSEFASGDIHLNDNTAVKYGATLAAPDMMMFWNTGTSALRFSPFFGTVGNPLDLVGTATDIFRFQGDPGGLGNIALQFDVPTISFGTTAAQPLLNNFFVIFSGPSLRQPAAAGAYADVLWTAGGTIDINGLAITDLSAFQIDSIATILNGGTIADSSTLYLAGMASVNATRLQTLRVLGRSRLDGLLTFNEATLATLTADVAALALPANNLGRYVLLEDADALGPWTIQGIVNVQVGDEFKIINNGANAFDFGHEDAAAAAADRIITPSAATWTLGAREFAVLWYDPVATRWRILESNGA